LTPSEVHIGRGQVVETLVVAAQVVVSNELREALFELTWQVVVLDAEDAGRARISINPLENATSSETAWRSGMNSNPQYRLWSLR
jgi:hypothetical protein